MNSPQSVQKLLNYEAGEESLIGSLLGLGFFGFLAMVLVRTSTYSLYLSVFDYQTLPFVFIAAALLAMAISAISLVVLRRLPLGSVLVGNALVMVSIVLALRIAVGVTQARWAIFGLPVAFHVLMPLMITSFWALVQRLFNIRQSRRLSGLVVSSETLAMILGGVVTPLTVRFAGSVNVLLVAAACLLIYTGILIGLIRRHDDELRTRPSRLPAQRGATGAVLGNRYVLLIMLNFTLFVTSIYFVDNIFYGFAQLRISDPDTLTSLLGRFWAVAGILILFVQLLVAGRMLERYGVGAVLMLLPLALAAGGTLLVAAGLMGGSTALLFGLAIGIELTRTVLDATDQTATNVLFQPLPDQVRTEAQTFVTGIVYPGALGLTGAVLLICFEVFQLGLLQVSGVMVLVALLWAGVARRLGKRYRRALADALDRRTFHPVELTVLDASSLQVLHNGLNSPNAAVVSTCLSFLVEVDPQAVEAVLPRLLAHPEPAVRLAAVETVSRLHLTRAVPLLASRLSLETSSTIRCALLTSIGVLDGADSEDLIMQFMHDPDPIVRQGAWAGLLSRTASKGHDVVEAALAASLQSPEAQARIYAAGVIAESGSVSLFPHVIRLLQDDVAAVRRAGLRTAARLGHPQLWPWVIKCVDDHRTRAPALRTLVSAGSGARPAISEGLDAYTDNPPVQLRLIRVAGQLDDDEALALLEGKISLPDEQTRTAVLTALRSCNYQAPAAISATITNQIDEEIAYAAWLAAALVELKPGSTAAGEAIPPTALIHAALLGQLVRVRIRLICLLSFLQNSTTLTRVGAILKIDQRRQWTPTTHAERQRRAYALETLEMLLPAEQKRLILAIVDGRPAHELLRTLSREYPQARKSPAARLREVINDAYGWSGNWVKATAIDAAARLPAPALQKVVRTNLNAADPLVRETAAWTLERFEQEQANESDTLRHDCGEPLMLTTIEKVIALKSSSFFAGLEDEILAEVAAFVEVERVAAGEEIFAKGDYGDTLYIVAAGQVRLTDGDVTFGELSPYEAFGEFALLDPAPRSASAVALSDTTLLVLDALTFDELIDDQSSVARRIMQRLVQRIRDASVQITDDTDAVAPTSTGW